MGRYLRYLRGKYGIEITMPSNTVDKNKVFYSAR